MTLPWPIGLILQQRYKLPRYSVRVLLLDLKSTGYHFIHIQPVCEGGNIEYNLENRPPNPSPNEYCREYPLCDGTLVIFPFDLDESSDSVGTSGGPPCLDSDGNEYHDEYHNDDESSDDESREGPPSIDSDGHAIVE